MRALAFLLVFLALPFLSYAETGSHGGEVESIRPIPSSTLLRGYSIELVEESDSGSKNRSFRIYLLGKNSESIDLMNVGYWMVEWRTEKKRGRLPDKLKREKERVWKEEPPYTPLYSFVASGDLPEDSDLVLDVTLALPSKGGTGIASFNRINLR